jgi:hypothetical protein
MPFFAKGVTRNKLIILFYANVSQLELTKEQLYRAMVENECMGYFDFQSMMNELEEDGYLAAIPRTFGQGYRITVRGTDALSLFQESLEFSLREKLKAYAAEHREQMRKETQLVSQMEEQQDGSYLVRLKAQEQKTVLLDISILVATRSMAQRIRKNWEGASEGIYSYMLENLLKQEED